MATKVCAYCDLPLLDRKGKGLGDKNVYLTEDGDDWCDLDPNETDGIGRHNPA